MAEFAHDTLRLNEAQVQEVLELLRKRGIRDTGASKRSSQRFDYRASTPMTIDIEQPGGDSQAFRVIARDLSTTGLGFLHGVFVHSGVTCNVELQALDGSRVRVLGTVTRCELVKGRVHFVGVRFDRAIDPAAFVQTSDEEPARESSNHSKRQGKVDETRRLLEELTAQCAAHDCPPGARRAAARLVEAFHAMLGETVEPTPGAAAHPGERPLVGPGSSR